MSEIMSPTTRPAVDHSADSAASACEAKGATVDQVAYLSWRGGRDCCREFAERRKPRRRADADRLGGERQRLLGETTGRENARHA